MVVKKKYRNVAFLAELMINILVFSISCAVLVSLFGAAATVSRETHEQSLAGTEVLALVELAKTGGLQRLAEDGAPLEAGQEWLDTLAGQQTAEEPILPEEVGDYIVLGYGDNWQPDADAPPYRVTVFSRGQAAVAGELHHICAVATDTSGRLIYRIETAVYKPKAGGVMADV